MLRNLATSLFLTEREDEYYDHLTQSDGRTAVNAPAQKGRVVTTLEKAKEARSLVERCITIAKRAQASMDEAQQYETDAERNTDEWKNWRNSEQHKKWVAAIAPSVAARRRVFAILRDKEAVSLLFEEIAPRYMDRPGGYTRVLRLAKPRLGDAGTQAILELVGTNDRVSTSSAKPAFGDDDDLSDETSDSDVGLEDSAPVDDVEASAGDESNDVAAEGDEEEKKEG
jgi:large subunit ribosomal protein L17